MNTVQSIRNHTRCVAPSKDEFRYKLLNRLFQYCYQYHDGNRDYWRFGPPRHRTIRRYLKDCVKQFFGTRGYVARHFATERATDQLISVLALADDYQNAFHQLADESSREWFMDLICFRTLGPAHVRLSLNNRRYWDQYASVDNNYLKQKNVAEVYFLDRSRPLNRYEVPGENGPLTLDVRPLNVLNTFILEQYAYTKMAPPIRARPGDTVIDAGGCYGDTTLYFADRVGQTGKVLTFEFVPENLQLLRRNLDHNPKHRPQVELVEKALWNRSGLLLDYIQEGPASCIRTPNGSQQHSRRTATVTIDALVEPKGLPKVDFIKMDIEGAELRALHGAEETLRRHRPKLAICIYHRQDDFITIPAYLGGLDLNYSLFIDHFTTHADETVLFAAAED